MRHTDRKNIDRMIRRYKYYAGVVEPPDWVPVMRLWMECLGARDKELLRLRFDSRGGDIVSQYMAMYSSRSGYYRRLNRIYEDLLFIMRDVCPELFCE